MNHFIKYNHSPYPQSLQAEADGLTLLEQNLAACHAAIKTPQVLAVNENELHLTKITATKPKELLQRRLGHHLAKMHQIENPYCGLEHDNYIGLSPQHNQISEHWGAFFWRHRLLFQVELISDAKIKDEFKSTLQQSHAKLTAWLDESCSHFSLLHGDLWSGNVLFDEHDVWLIDPAIYYGDADADLAMSELFGGFSPAFYAAYFEIKPQAKNYPLKKIIYNLYHQLNHYNLFGNSYLNSCQQGMNFIHSNFA